MGCVAYSDTAMYVFVGLGPVDLDSDDENSESDFLPPQMSDARSFSHKNLEWTCHWWKGLPGPRTYYYNELGTPGVPLDTDLSVSPPIDGSGTLLAHTDPTTELERTYFSTTPRIEPRTRVWSQALSTWRTTMSTVFGSFVMQQYKPIQTWAIGSRCRRVEPSHLDSWKANSFYPPLEKCASVPTQRS